MLIKIRARRCRRDGRECVTVSTSQEGADRLAVGDFVRTTKGLKRIGRCVYGTPTSHTYEVIQ